MKYRKADLQDQYSFVMRGIYNIRGTGQYATTRDWKFWWFDKNYQYHEELFKDKHGYFPKRYDKIVRSGDYISGDNISQDYEVMKLRYTKIEL